MRPCHAVAEKVRRCCILCKVALASLSEGRPAKGDPNFAAWKRVGRGFGRSLREEGAAGERDDGELCGRTHPRVMTRTLRHFVYMTSREGLCVAGRNLETAHVAVAGRAVYSPGVSRGTGMLDVSTIRSLVARAESPTLDFKKVFYSNDDAGTSEFAKDLTAIANALRATSTERGYILFGVSERSDGSGEIVGLQNERWITDANLHQKVSSLLNRCPDFSWRCVELDGIRVGVIEIVPGGRPFFPLRDKGTLRRHVSLIRVGSSTDIASPDQILEWARDDQRDAAQALELRKLEAEITPRGALLPGTRFVGGGNDLTLEFYLSNEGLGAIELTFASASWGFHQDVLCAGLKDLGVTSFEVPPPQAGQVLFRQQMLRPKDTCPLHFIMTLDEVERRFRALNVDAAHALEAGGLRKVLATAALGSGECRFVSSVGGMAGKASCELRWLL